MLLCSGVCDRPTLTAADSGLVRTDEDAISVGGTSHGADTVLVLRPANSHNLFDLKIKEILCKPRLLGI